MPKIQPFAAYRYNPERIESLSDVVAPPYDVIDQTLSDELHAKHPDNVVRLILNPMTSEDDAENNRYTRSAKTLQQWKDDSILIQDAQPSVYVYHQIFKFNGKTYTRKGFMCRCEAVPFGEGSVFPHELTMSGPKMDRLMLTTACKMNFSQIFGLYPDAENKTQNLLEQYIQEHSAAGKTNDETSELKPIEATDHLGVIHRMWTVSDPEVIAKVVEEMSAKPVFIADGHHRYETACNYRKQIAQQGMLTPEHPANYVLMVCIAMDDPGLIVQPTHRMFPNVPYFSVDDLIEKLGNCFRINTVGSGAVVAEKAWALVSLQNKQDTMAVYTGKDGKWSLIELTDAGRKKMEELTPEHHPEWRELGVAILHELLVNSLLGLKGHEKPEYVHQVSEVVSGIREKTYPLAALVLPANVELIRDLSMLHERMPPKSTYFYPKLITGFVFNPLD